MQLLNNSLSSMPFRFIHHLNLRFWDLFYSYLNDSTGLAVAALMA